MATLEERFRAAIGRAADEHGDDVLLSWFDGGAGETQVVAKVVDREHAWKSGAVDFTLSVLRHPVGQLLSTDGGTEKKTALEIGYGGGRILCAATRCFSHVTGVDIHGQSERISNLLRAQGVSNFTLHTTEGRSLPVADASIDFVYSFVVLLHLSSSRVFEDYLAETFRVLGKRGIASLYYGRPYSHRTRTAQHPWAKKVYGRIESLAEAVVLDVLGDGYRSFEREPNAVTLTVSRRQVCRVARRLGFRVVSQQSGENWQQGFIVLQKP